MLSPDEDYSAAMPPPLPPPPPLPRFRPLRRLYRLARAC